MKDTISLNKNADFHRVYKKGSSLVGKYIVLYVNINYISKKRLGIVISRKVGNSVKRNRIRRLIKENYRYYEINLKDNYDYIFISRKCQVIPDFYNIKKEMKYLFKKLKMIDQENLD